MADEETPGETEAGLDHIGPVLFQDAHDRFVLPEVLRRREIGEWSDDIGIYRFQVLLHPERQLEVRLNEEIGGTVEATATRPMEKGEDVVLEDISGVKGYKPMLDDEGVPHITAFAHRDGWSVAFNFNYRHPRRFEYLESGQQFAETAREALGAERVGVALDNAFSAVELLAKAELLSCHPTIEAALSSHSHGGVATPYSLWARLENTDPRFVRLLYRLQELRPAGRYLNKELALKEGELEELFERLGEMEEHVKRIAEDEIGPGPHGFNVVATRELKAGQIVTRSDFALKPEE